MYPVLFEKIKKIKKDFKDYKIKIGDRKDLWLAPFEKKNSVFFSAINFMQSHFAQKMYQPPKMSQKYIGKQFSSEGLKKSRNLQNFDFFPNEKQLKRGQGVRSKR